MGENTDTKVRATVWLKPGQVDALRSACYDVGADYLQQRNEAIIALMYDTGLRVGELVAVDVEHLRDGHSMLYLPGHIQKDYPTENSPGPVRLSLSAGTTRVLRAYLNSRWKESAALFPSRSSDRITTQGVRDMLKKVAHAADVAPFNEDGTRGTADDVTPHALRHSVAWRMMNAEDGNTLYDVRNRLRHRSISTTEQVYDHFKEV
jgi:integrase/recombinase XerC/integrase/recombinase XerD